MSAVARVWWTFFTALPLQRWLAGSGVVLGAGLAIAGFAVQQPFWPLGLLAVFILAVFPALFASAAIFRALSASRANQLLPRFRTQMLAAIMALEAAGIGFFALLLFALALLGDRAAPLEPLVYAFAFGTGTFLLMFLMFGDWRWMWVWLGASVGFSVLGLSSRSALAAIPGSAWLVAALGAWVAFGGWYLRARHVKPLALVPQPHAGRWSRTDLADTVTRERALRVLVSSQLPWSQPRLFAGMVGIVVIAGIIAIVPPAARSIPFTSFLWSLAMMVLLWGNTTAVVHRSRLLWLRIPGTRDAVRREVERELLRKLAGIGLMLLGAAVLYGSPLVAAPAREVLAGFALAAGAGLFGTYAAFATTPSNAIQLVSIALLMVAHIAVLSSPSPSLTGMAIITTFELTAAIGFRAFAIARWRQIDWLRLRPLPPSNMFRGGG